jgi:glc operon protein GlcG
MFDDENGLFHEGLGWKLDAGRRDEPGEVEFHERTTDVMYVVEGEATVVTGGQMNQVREIAPGELRAASVVGGTAQELKPGDVLAIPAGVPHWFTDVTSPFRYFVVKVS